MTGASILLMGVLFFTFRSWNPLFSIQREATPVSSSTPAPLTPTRTASATPTASRTVIPTTSSTPTPHLPLSLEIMVVSSVTPQANAVITDVRFSDRLIDMLPVGNILEWENPVYRIYASYEYSHMTYGAQFTALWFRNSELVYFESGPWETGGHGRGYSKWEPAPHEWHPGEYEVQFFVGTVWKATGYFTVTGEPLPPTVTPTLTLTNTPTATLTPSPVPTLTPVPTD